MTPQTLPQSPNVVKPAPWWTEYTGPTTRDPATGDLLVWRPRAATAGYYPATDGELGAYAAGQAVGR